MHYLLRNNSVFLIKPQQICFPSLWISLFWRFHRIELHGLYTYNTCPFIFVLLHLACFKDVSMLWHGSVFLSFYDLLDCMAIPHLLAIHQFIGIWVVSIF